MPFPYSEDVKSIFEGGDFDSAAYTHAAVTTTIYGMFDVSFHDPLGIEGNYPRFTCATADVPSVAHGDTLVVGLKTYKVVQVDPDGIGSVLLKLQEQ